MAALPLTTQNAKAAFDGLVQQAMSAKGTCLTIQQATAALPWRAIRSLIDSMLALSASATSVLSSPALQPALNAYVQQITGQTTYNFLPDFQASIAAAQAVVTAAVSEYPRDALGNMLDQNMTSAGVIADNTFTSANIPKTLAAITGWLATVA